MAVSVLVAASGQGDNNTPPVVPTSGSDRYWLIAVQKENTWANIPSTVIVAGDTDTTLDLIASNSSATMKVALYGCKDADFGTNPTAGNGDLTYNADGDTPTSAAIVVSGIVLQGVDQTTPFTNTVDVGWATDSTNSTEDCPFTLDEVADGMGVAFVSCSKTGTTWGLTDNSYTANGSGQWTQGSNTSGNCAVKAISSNSSAATTTLTSGLTGDKTGTLAIMMLPVSSGGDDLLANDVESDSEVSAPSVGQEHAILANDVESASETSAPAVDQEHALLADDTESATEVSAPSLSESHSLLADDVQSTSEVSAPAVGQEHAILADDVQSTSEVSAPSVGQEHTLLADDVESASELTAPAVGQAHAILADDVESSSEVTLPTLAEGADDVLLADDVESSSEVTSPSLGQVHTILADDVESLSEVGAPQVDRPTVEKKAGGRSSKPRRYSVEIEGQFFVVGTIAEAKDLLVQTRELAEESARQIVSTPVTPKPPRVSVKTVSGNPTASKVIQAEVKKTQKTINRAYMKAARDIAQNQEISKLLIRKIEHEQIEEETLIALLM